MRRTVALRPDWDRQLKLGDDRGHHVTRADADRALADFIGRRTEGALLVVGHRGSGKTSSVINAANRAAARPGHDPPTLAILVKATSIDTADKKSTSKSLLQCLIWALHRRVGDDKSIDKDLRRRTLGLYLDSTASVKTDEVVRSDTRSQALVSILYHAAMAISVLGALAYEGLIAHGWVAAAVLAPFLGKWVWERRTSKSVTRRYERTYGHADMEHDLDDLLQRYGKSHKIVFILDEFDKVEFSAMIRPLKMLFNQGGALYVVITAPDMAAEFLPKGIIPERKKDYTLFSEIVFINRPRFKEMDQFLDSVVDPSAMADIPAPEYDDFKCYMRYRSQSDFFDLYRALRDCGSGADGRGRPLVTISLSDAEKTQANLQRAIEYVYERKAYGSQSMQMANDEMLDEMYEAAGLAEQAHGKTVSVGSKIIFDNEGERIQLDDVGLAARDLLLLLFRQGYLKKTPEDTYLVVGRLTAFTRTGIFVEEENAFINAYDAMLGALADFANVKSSLVDGHGEPFDRDSPDARIDDMISAVSPIVSVVVHDEARECRAKLRLPGRPLVDPDKLREHADTSRNMLDSLCAASVDLLYHVLASKGVETSLHDDVPSDVASLSFAQGTGTRSAAYGWSMGDREVCLAVLLARDTTFLSKLRGAAGPPRRKHREIVVVLAGRTALAGLRDNAVTIGSVHGVEGGHAGDGAASMARNRATYALAIAAPPSPGAAKALVSILGLIVDHHGSSGRKSFEPLWSRMLDTARGAGASTNGGDGAAGPAGKGPSVAFNQQQAETPAAGDLP